LLRLKIGTIGGGTYAHNMQQFLRAPELVKTEPLIERYKPPLPKSTKSTKNTKNYYHKSL